jgi:hypothetical protein
MGQAEDKEVCGRLRAQRCRLLLAVLRSPRRSAFPEHDRQQPVELRHRVVRIVFPEKFSIFFENQLEVSRPRTLFPHPRFVSFRSSIRKACLTSALETHKPSRPDVVT